MNFHHIPWEPVLLGVFKLLKFFGLIPGAIAAYAVRRFYQRRRQNRAISGWPATDATIHSGQVHSQGFRSYWVDLTYTYFVGEYRTGKHIHRFHRKQDAEEFLRKVNGQRVRVHYDEAKPDTSVILDRDLEMIALMSPQYR
jgi:hypothetical protein